MSAKLLTLFLGLGILTASSCKNCTECTRYPNANDTVELCKKDYASDDSYNNAFKHLVADGYKCD